MQSSRVHVPGWLQTQAVQMTVSCHNLGGEQSRCLGHHKDLLKVNYKRGKKRGKKGLDRARALIQVFKMEGGMSCGDSFLLWEFLLPYLFKNPEVGRFCSLQKHLLLQMRSAISCVRNREGFSTVILLCTVALKEHRST